MSNSCCVCKSRCNSDRSVHRSPKDEELRRKWEEAIGYSDCRIPFYVCSEHFKDSDYINRTNCRLKKKAVPYVNDGYKGKVAQKNVLTKRATPSVRKPLQGSSPWDTTSSSKPQQLIQIQIQIQEEQESCANCLETISQEPRGYLMMSTAVEIEGGPSCQIIKLLTTIFPSESPISPDLKLCKTCAWNLIQGFKFRKKFESSCQLGSPLSRFVRKPRVAESELVEVKPEINSFKLHLSEDEEQEEEEDLSNDNECDDPLATTTSDSSHRLPVHKAMVKVEQLNVDTLDLPQDQIDKIKHQPSDLQLRRSTRGRNRLNEIGSSDVNSDGMKEVDDGKIDDKNSSDEDYVTENSSKDDDDENFHCANQVGGQRQRKEVKVSIPLPIRNKKKHKKIVKDPLLSSESQDKSETEAFKDTNNKCEEQRGKKRTSSTDVNPPVRKRRKQIKARALEHTDVITKMYEGFESGKSAFNCGSCEKTFAFKAEWMSHSIMEHSEKSFLVNEIIIETKD